jgi:type I restriction enzyme, S subunit
VRKNWDVKPLGEFSDIKYGYTAKADSEPVGPRFLRITDIQNGEVNWDQVPFCKVSGKDHVRHKVRAGDIVFARTGATTGKSFLIKEAPDTVCASYLIKVRPNTTAVHPSFLNIYFQTSEYWDAIALGTEGAAQGGFNASKLGALPIPLPPLEEQQRIVTVLDEAFEGLARARAHAEANLQNARELFAGTISAEFAKIDSSEKKRVGDVAVHSLGKMLDKNKNKGTLRPYLRNLNVRWFTVDTSDLLEMRITDAEVERYTVKKGDLLICEGAIPGDLPFGNRTKKYSSRRHFTEYGSKMRPTAVF